MRSLPQEHEDEKECRRKEERMEGGKLARYLYPMEGAGSERGGLKRKQTGERDGLAGGRKRAGDVGDRGARISPSPLVSNDPSPTGDYCVLCLISPCFLCFQSLRCRLSYLSLAPRR
jgi:hypothetical protein